MSESPRDLVRDLLETIAEETGDRSYRRAANALMWELPGGKPKNPRADDRAIADAQDLLAKGGAKSLHNALVLTARAKWPYANSESVAERLRRRIKRAARRLPLDR